MTTSILFTAHISPALHARLVAWKSEPAQPVRKTARQRRAEAAERRLAKERAAREAAFQRRVDAIAAELYQPFQPRERCLLDTAPILTDDQRQFYARQANYDSAGKQEQKRIRREMKDQRRRERREAMGL